MLERFNRFLDQLLDPRSRLGLRLSIICLLISMASLVGCFLDHDMDAVSVGVGLVFGGAIAFFVWCVLDHFIHRQEVSGDE